MARFWLYNANSTGILILVLLLIWMVRVMQWSLPIPFEFQDKVQFFLITQYNRVLKLADGQWF